MSALRLVLDTNVALDLFHWENRVAAPILAAAQAGRCELLIDAACFAEFSHVIARPEFRQESASAAAAIAAYRSLARMDGCAPTCQARPLPRCSDPDDQKFLELARNAAADLLVTRDKALLTLARRKYALAAFRIVRPAEAVDLIAASGMGLEP